MKKPPSQRTRDRGREVSDDTHASGHKTLSGGVVIHTIDIFLQPLEAHMVSFRSARTRNIHPAIAQSLGETFSDHEMTALSRLGTIANIGAGQRFATEGSIGQEAVVIISGTADVVRNEDIIATVGAGTILGEISLLSGDPRNASLIAHDDVVAVVMSSREFRSLLDQCPRLANEVDHLIEARSSAA